MAHITFVKKILADGSLCKKCQEVSERMASEGLLAIIDHIVIADERDPDSPGMLLAKQHEVSRAPFFVLEDESGEHIVFDVYFKFKKHVSELGLTPVISSAL
jgi:hypothetical protein